MPDKFKCPDCEATFTNVKSLGPHRRMAHGYRKLNPKNPAFINNAGKFPCPHCDFIAQWKGGLTFHLRKKHKAKPERTTAIVQSDKDAKTIVSTTNGTAPTHDGNHRLEAAATFAAGRIAQLLESLALQHDLPPKSLTALVLRTVHTTTLR